MKYDITAATQRLQASTQVTAMMKGKKVGDLIDKNFHGAEFAEPLNGAVGDNDTVSGGVFYTSISQVEMRQLEALQKGGLHVTGVAIAKDGKRLAISFKC